MASTQSPQQPSSYHVFLSFRGADTRKNFTDHLYNALIQQGIHTFRDNDEIERGENIESEIFKAIRESKLSIIVLSEDYASSKWCLDELVLIMERRKLIGHVVVPVFYHVDRVQVRDQTGPYADAFAFHIENLKEEISRVDQWREALREVADLGGMVANDFRFESQLVKNLVREVENKLIRTVINVAPHLVGIDSRIWRINSWIQEESDDVEIATIYGIGGIGKTTIAKMVYNMNFNRFDARNFLANVKEVSEQPNGLVHLQKRLLSDLVKGKARKIYNVDEGITMIRDALRGKKMLLVLDDVDDLEQSDWIVGMRKWFHPGSKIVITTRHERLLKFHDFSRSFEVQQLDKKESLELFCWHAFGQNCPVNAYEELSKNVVQHCGGLPLALRVLGSSLSDKSLAVWESALEKLERIADGEIQQVLRISFDSLPDDHDKRLFLDIACFFARMDIGYAFRVLDGCGYFAIDGIQNLVSRCLLTVNEEHKLIIHQLLRDMGREIVRQESPDDPGKRSRLWNPIDSATVLRENTGTDSITGLNLNLSILAEDKRKSKNSTAEDTEHSEGASRGKSMSRDEDSFLKRRRLSIFSWQKTLTEPVCSFFTEAFENMVILKLLNLNCVELSGSYKKLPKSLVWLCWRGFSLTSLPTDLCLDKLVALDMRNSNLKYLWKGTRVLVKLRILNLGHSHRLVRAPDFSGLPNLEKLVLKDCVNLIDLDESIGVLEKLIILNLKDCKRLKKLPKEITMLTFLEELILSGCSNLTDLPEHLENLESLRLLHADGTALNWANSSNTDELNELRLSLWKSTSLSWLLQRRWAKATNFSSASLPRFLVSLSLADCRLSDNAIPADISSLSSLEHLNLSGNPFRFLPESVSSLDMLNSLVLERCENLQTIPELPTNLGSLKAEDCTSLERITNLPNLLKSLEFKIFGCEKLVEIQGLFKLEPIKNANKEILNYMGLTEYESLRGIEMEMSNAMSCTEMKMGIQVLDECGIFNVFLPGSSIPDWFSQKSDSSSISFEVGPVPEHKVKGLSICALYIYDKLEGGGYIDENCIKINNETAGVKWTYSPNFYGMPKPFEHMLWLSYWTFGDELLAGDEVHLVVEMASGLSVKECGIKLIYEPEERAIDEIEIEPSSSSSLYKTMGDIDMEAYELGTNAYLLSHHKFETHQGSGRYDWDDLRGYEYLFEKIEDDEEDSDDWI